jgi:hypothetical protein
VSIFFERFVLPIFVAVIMGFVIFNPSKWDVRQRVSLGISIVAMAYFIGHSLTLKRTETPPSSLTTPPSSVVAPSPKSITTGPVSTTGPQSPVVIGDGSVSYGTPAEKKKSSEGKKP